MLTIKRKVKLISYIIAFIGVITYILINFYSFFIIVIPYKYTLLWGTSVIVFINFIIIAQLQGKKIDMLITVLTFLLIAFIVSLVT